jgi:hypothetical protein
VLHVDLGHHTKRFTLKIERGEKVPILLGRSRQSLLRSMPLR